MNAHLQHVDTTTTDHDPTHSTPWLDTLGDLLDLSARHIALLAAWIALCGSLFMSEVLGWRPCLLCWYQRILMYPLAIVLAIGILRRDRGLPLYVLPFSVVGSGVSLYHYLLIKTDWLPPPDCALDVPCTVDYLNWFGVINIPLLALTAFLIITCMMLTTLAQPSTADDEWGALGPADDPAASAPLVHLDTAAIAAVLVIVGVVLAFVLASTFV